MPDTFATDYELATPPAPPAPSAKKAAHARWRKDD